MTHKERFYATIERRPVDKPASWLSDPVPAALIGLYKHFKVDNMFDLKQKLDDDIYPVEVPYNHPPAHNISCAFDFAKENCNISTEERTLAAPGFFEDMTDPSLVETFPWPDPSKHIDVDESRRRAKEVPSDYAKMGVMWSCHFQDVCAAFGMENSLITMYTAPEMYQAVIDRITKFYLQANEIFYEATKGELDAVMIGDDFGTQAGLLTSPDSLRQFVFPGTKLLIDQAKSYGLRVIYHSCGSIYPVIEDLFDMGVDVIHPIQALAKDMEPERLKADFGDRGAFFGGVDAQYLMVNGTPEEVREKVTYLKEVFPTGLIISPSHGTILPDMNPANIEALFKSIN